jgi:CDP-paratose 2-epimerase
MRGKRVLITGGAGFVGCNAAQYFGNRNWRVTVLDDLSRDGTEQNLEWLRDGTAFDFERVDIRDRAAVDRVLAERRYDAVIHLAAQPAAHRHGAARD